MSNLPKLNQEVSEHLGKNSITVPSDPRAKEADVDRKMRVYGIFQGFRQGKLPSNKQAVEALDYFASTAPFETGKLSREGQQLIEGFRKVIMDAKRIVEVKNEDELLQNFIWNTRDIDVGGHKENLKSMSSPVDKDTAQSEGQQAVENLRILAKLLFTNSEVRKLLSDVAVLGRDVAADAATHLADKARPDEDSLRNADEPGPDAQWVHTDGSTRGPNDPVPDTGVGGRVNQLKEKKDQAKSKAQDAKNDAQNQAQDQKNRSQQRAQNEGDPNDPDQQARLAKEEASNSAGRMKNMVSDRLPTGQASEQAGNAKDKVKGTAQDQTNKAKDYFKDKFPEERREKFIYRLKKVVIEQQKHDDYNQAVDFFIDQFYNYKGRTQDVAHQSKGKGGDIRGDPAYQNAEMELRILLERFANNTSMQPIFDAVDVMYSDSKRDPELRHWWNEAGNYIRRVLQEEGYIMTDAATDDGNRLVDSGKRFWDHKYKGHREDLLNSIEEFAYAYNEDPLNRQLGVDIKNLIKDLGTDNEGKLTYKPHLIADLRHIILPSVLGQIGYIPIPRAEYTDNQFDIVVENLTLEMTNLLPNIIEITNRNYFKLSPFSNMGDLQQHELRIGFSQIQADMRDVAFYFKKKSGFPRLSDSGLADVLISGRGIYGDIHIETTPTKASMFRVVDVTIEIDELKFKIRDSKHNFLYSAIRHTATGIIKKAVAKAAQLAIRQALVQVDAQLTDIRDAAREGAADENSSRSQAIKDRMAAKKDKGAGAKDKTKEKAEERNSQFRLVTQRDQEMINWESKASYVGKEGTLANHAKSTNDSTWKSPVFSIVGNSPTMNRDIVNQDISNYKHK